MSLPSASTLKIDGHIKNLGLTSTGRRDVLIHGQGIDQEPVETFTWRLVVPLLEAPPLPNAWCSRTLCNGRWCLMAWGLGSAQTSPASIWEGWSLTGCFRTVRLIFLCPRARCESLSTELCVA